VRDLGGLKVSGRTTIIVRKVDAHTIDLTAWAFGRVIDHRRLTVNR
jgi:hypothetical protein